MKGVTAAMFVGYRMRHVMWYLYGEVKGLNSWVTSKVPLHCPLDRRSASCAASASASPAASPPSGGCLAKFGRALSRENVNYSYIHRGVIAAQ